MNKRPEIEFGEQIAENGDGTELTGSWVQIQANGKKWVANFNLSRGALDATKIQTFKKYYQRLEIQNKPQNRHNADHHKRNIELSMRAKLRKN